MTVQVQYEADLDSEVETREERYQWRLERYERELKSAQKWINDIVVPPPPNLNDPDYGTKHGIFTLDIAEIQALMELAERNEDLLQVGTGVESVSPHWRREWSFTPTEYYARVRSELNTIQSVAEFNWKLLEPVYGPDGEGIDRLVAYLLEHGKCVCWCKACQQEYRAVELEIYNWENGESEGSMYLCPKDHALVRTYGRSMGALETFSREGRTKRERQPDPVEEWLIDLPKEQAAELEAEKHEGTARRQGRKWWQFWL